MLIAPAVQSFVRFTHVLRKIERKRIFDPSRLMRTACSYDKLDLQTREHRNLP